MTVACIIQARLGSTRLPAKVLLPLPTGRTVLEEVIRRCKQIPGVDCVVVAMPDTPENDILWHFITPIGPMAIVTGSEHDVLGRYLRAAHHVRAAVVVRITADCPLIDPTVCGRVVALVKNGGCDYASNVHPRSYPAGLDCEAFTMQALISAASDATEAYDREHVTPAIIRNAPRSGNVHDGEDRSHLRWTLDTLQDYTTIWHVMEQQMREAA